MSHWPPIFRKANFISCKNRSGFPEIRASAVRSAVADSLSGSMVQYNVRKRDLEAVERRAGGERGLQNILASGHFGAA